MANLFICHVIELFATLSKLLPQERQFNFESISERSLFEPCFPGSF